MSFRNWLDEGYYIEDGYGEFSKTDDPKSATHYHDGYTLNKISEKENKKWKDDYGDVSIFSHWKDDDDDDMGIFSHWKEQ